MIEANSPLGGESVSCSNCCDRLHGVVEWKRRNVHTYEVLADVGGGTTGRDFEKKGEKGGRCAAHTGPVGAQQSLAEERPSPFKKKKKKVARNLKKRRVRRRKAPASLKKR